MKIIGPTENSVFHIQLHLHLNPSPLIPISSASSAASRRRLDPFQTLPHQLNLLVNLALIQI